MSKGKDSLKTSTVSFELCRIATPTDRLSGPFGGETDVIASDPA